MKPSTERAETYFGQIEQNLPDRLILKELHSFFINRKEVVLQIVDTGAEDETIRQFISEVFGIMGGGSIRGNEQARWYEYAGGMKPRLTIQNADWITVDELQGQNLIDAFRDLYRVPKGGQLYLF